MSIISQKDATENCSAAVKNLIQLLAVPVSRKTLEEIKYRKDYPSLLAVSAMLSEWNIDNLAIKIDSKRLVEIPLPAVAHLRKNSGHFVVLTRQNGDRLQYIDPESGMVEESIRDFEQKWDGVILLASKTDKSGEDQYSVRRGEELFEQVSKYVVGALVVAVLAFAFWMIAVDIFLLLVVKYLGLYICILLVSKQFGGDNSILKYFCQVNAKSDCNAVIHSRASVIGFIHVSELGLMYFVGGFLASVLGGLSQTNLFGWLLLMSLAGLFYSVFSIYYQWAVLKMWCPLCLLVIALIWIEASLIIGLVPSFQFSMKAMAILAMGFSIPIAFWLLLRQRLIDSFKLASAEMTADRILKSEKIFSFLLNDQPGTNMEHGSSEIILGDSSSITDLTIVSNPLCGPCARAHAFVDGMMKKYQNELRVTYRFVFDSTQKGSYAWRMVEHLVGLSVANPNEVAGALSHWYTGGGKHNPEQWFGEHPITNTVDPSFVKKIMDKQIEWARKVGIESTPTIFLNGKRVPQVYSLKDLAYQMGKQLR